MIGFDTETDPFAPGLQFPPIVCGQFARGGRSVIVSEAEILDTLRSCIDSGETFIGHTIAYDFGVCCAMDPTLLPVVFDLYDSGRVLDLAVRQKLLDIATGRRKGSAYALSDLARRYGFGSLDKSDDGPRKRFQELRGVPISEWDERARAYALADVDILHPIFKAQEACDHGGVLEDQHRQSAYAWWLKLMSGWGLMTDEAGVASFAAAVHAEYEDLAHKLRCVGLLRPDRVIKSGPRKGQVKPGSRDTKAAKAIMSRFVDAMSREDQERGGFFTKSGDVSLNKKVCREVDSEELTWYAELSSLKKTISTDIPLLSHRPIHSYFDSLQDTGRIASSSPNVTNLPRRPGVRECFVPRPGTCFVSADYGGIELFTWAEVCFALFGYSQLGEELKAGIDPHMTIAADIMSQPIEWCLAHKKNDKVKDARQTGKVLNFGKPGGIGAERLAFFAKSSYDVDLTVERAAELSALWVARRPEMKDYSRYIDRIVRSGAPLEQLYSGRFRGGASYTEACNSLFQGLASDIAKSAGLLVSRACYVDRESALFGCRIVNFVHDEFILEVPIGRQHEAAIELERLMTIAARQWLQHLPPPKIESDAMMRWSKAVVPLFVAGRLVPWVRKIDDTHHVALVDGREIVLDLAARET